CLCLDSCFILSCFAILLAFFSFPTRRSSDLARESRFELHRAASFARCSREWSRLRIGCAVMGSWRLLIMARAILRYTPTPRSFRSEEHTSELQSRFDLVCRLLLEKKQRYILL